MITFIYINDYLEDSYENCDIAITIRYLQSHGVEPHINRFRCACSVAEMFHSCYKDSAFFGFYLYDFTADLIFELSEKIKMYNSSATIFLFGPAASLAAEKILQDAPYIDGIVLGDAERVILDLMQKKKLHIPLDNNENWYGRSEKRFAKKYAITDIPEAFFPRCTRRFMQVITSRGCYGNCSFCIHSNFYYKEKNMCWIGLDAEKIFDQIRRLYEQSNIYYLSFFDKCFSDPPGEEGKKKLRKLFELLIDFDKPIAFSCFFRADSFGELDKYLLELMRRAKFTQVNIGIESAWKNDLLLFNKGTTTSDNENCMRLFKQHDIEVIADFIMFHPLSTIESINSNIDFLSKNNVYRLNTFFSRLRIFYGSPLYQFFLSHGYIAEDFSYKNTFQYDYLNKELGRGVLFFEYLLAMNNDLLSLQKKFLDFSEMFNICRAIFPSESAEIAADLKLLKTNISNHISEFFKVIFIRQDWDFVEGHTELWISELENLYISHNKLKKKLFSDQAINSFFSRYA